MPRRGKRKRLARGIYEDATGRSAVAYVGDHRQEKRFPPRTPLSVLRDWQESFRRKWKGSGGTAVVRGTLADAVDRWESQERHLASWKERRAELRAWSKSIGHLRLAGIGAEDVRRVIGQWSAKGVAPKTIRNRLWSLQHLYRVLHGPDAPTPVDHIDPPAKVRTVPVAIDPRVILTVYANLLEQERKGFLRDAKTRARFMLRASTGKRPSEIMRARPEDVDLERREWRVRDGKGGWSEGLYLNDDMLVAWRLFIDADAWGPFETSSQAKVLRAAGWPDNVDPYQLRHNVGIALSDAGVDLSDIAGVLGHKDLRTTRQTYVPIRRARMQRASEAIDGRLNGWNTAREHGTPDKSTT